jgi:ABC-2 type transport system permease protein
MTGLSIWRVELLRLVRTRRLLVLGFLYLFLGATGPLLAKYAQQIFSKVSSSSVKITVAKPTPADGILGFYKSATQLGLIACIVITGLGVCLDARPPLSTYYRTRAGIPRLLLPRLVASAVAAGAAYTFGLLFAWYETAVLIGAPDVGKTTATWALGLVYTLFAVALTFIVSGALRGTLAVVGCAIGIVIVLPIVGGVPALSRWVPSRLATLPADLYHGAGASSAAALVVTAAIVAVGVPAALRLLDRRQAL